MPLRFVPFALVIALSLAACDPNAPNRDDIKVVSSAGWMDNAGADVLLAEPETDNVVLRNIVQRKEAVPSDARLVSMNNGVAVFELRPNDRTNLAQRVPVVFNESTVAVRADRSRAVIASLAQRIRQRAETDAERLRAQGALSK